MHFVKPYFQITYFLDNIPEFISFLRRYQYYKIDNHCFTVVTKIQTNLHMYIKPILNLTNCP